MVAYFFSVVFSIIVSSALIYGLGWGKVVDHGGGEGGGVLA